MPGRSDQHMKNQQLNQNESDSIDDDADIQQDKFPRNNANDTMAMEESNQTQTNAEDEVEKSFRVKHLAHLVELRVSPKDATKRNFIGRDSPRWTYRFREDQFNLLAKRAKDRKGCQFDDIRESDEEDAFESAAEEELEEENEAKDNKQDHQTDDSEDGLEKDGNKEIDHRKHISTGKMGLGKKKEKNESIDMMWQSLLLGKHQLKAEDAVLQNDKFPETMELRDVKCDINEGKIKEISREDNGQKLETTCTSSFTSSASLAKTSATAQPPHKHLQFETLDTVQETSKHIDDEFQRYFGTVRPRSKSLQSLPSMNRTNLLDGPFDNPKGIKALSYAANQRGEDNFQKEKKTSIDPPSKLLLATAIISSCEEYTQTSEEQSHDVKEEAEVTLDAANQSGENNFDILTESPSQLLSSTCSIKPPLELLLTAATISSCEEYTQTSEGQPHVVKEGAIITSDAANKKGEVNFDMLTELPSKLPSSACSIKPPSELLLTAATQTLEDQSHDVKEGAVVSSDATTQSGENIFGMITESPSKLPSSPCSIKPPSGQLLTAATIRSCEEYTQTPEERPHAAKEGAASISDTANQSEGDYFGILKESPTDLPLSTCSIKPPLELVLTAAIIRSCEESTQTPEEQSHDVKEEALVASNTANQSGENNFDMLLESFSELPSSACSIEPPLELVLTASTIRSCEEYTQTSEEQSHDVKEGAVVSSDAVKQSRENNFDMLTESPSKLPSSACSIKPPLELVLTAATIRSCEESTQTSEQQSHIVKEGSLVTSDTSNQSRENNFDTLAKSPSNLPLSTSGIKPPLELLLTAATIRSCEECSQTSEEQPHNVKEGAVVSSDAANQSGENNFDMLSESPFEHLSSACSIKAPSELVLATATIRSCEKYTQTLEDQSYVIKEGAVVSSDIANQSGENNFDMLTESPFELPSSSNCNEPPLKLLLATATIRSCEEYTHTLEEQDGAVITSDDNQSEEDNFGILTELPFNLPSSPCSIKPPLELVLTAAAIRSCEEYTQTLEEQSHVVNEGAVVSSDAFTQSGENNFGMLTELPSEHLSSTCSIEPPSELVLATATQTLEDQPHDVKEGALVSSDANTPSGENSIGMLAESPSELPSSTCSIEPPSELVLTAATIISYEGYTQTSEEKPHVVKEWAVVSSDAATQSGENNFDVLTESQFKLPSSTCIINEPSELLLAEATIRSCEEYTQTSEEQSHDVKEGALVTSDIANQSRQNNFDLLTELPFDLPSSTCSIKPPSKLVLTAATIISMESPSKLPSSTCSIEPPSEQLLATATPIISGEEYTKTSKEQRYVVKEGAVVISDATNQRRKDNFEMLTESAPAFRDKSNLIQSYDNHVCHNDFLNSSYDILNRAKSSECKQSQNSLGNECSFPLASNNRPRSNKLDPSFQFKNVERLKASSELQESHPKNSMSGDDICGYDQLDLITSSSSNPRNEGKYGISEEGTFSYPQKTEATVSFYSPNIAAYSVEQLPMSSFEGQLLSLNSNESSLSGSSGSNHEVVVAEYYVREHQDNETKQNQPVVNSSTNVSPFSDIITEHKDQADLSMKEKKSFSDNSASLNFSTVPFHGTIPPTSSNCLSQLIYDDPEDNGIIGISTKKEHVTIEAHIKSDQEKVTSHEKTAKSTTFDKEKVLKLSEYSESLSGNKLMKRPDPQGQRISTLNALNERSCTHSNATHCSLNGSSKKEQVIFGSIENEKQTPSHQEKTTESQGNANEAKYGAKLLASNLAPMGILAKYDVANSNEEMYVENQISYEPNNLFFTRSTPKTRAPTFRLDAEPGVNFISENHRVNLLSKIKSCCEKGLAEIQSDFRKVEKSNCNQRDQYLVWIQGQKQTFHQRMMWITCQIAISVKIKRMFTRPYQSRK